MKLSVTGDMTANQNDLAFISGDELLVVITTNFPNDIVGGRDMAVLHELPTAFRGSSSLICHGSSP